MNMASRPINGSASVVEEASLTTLRTDDGNELVIELRQDGFVNAARIAQAFGAGKHFCDYSKANRAALGSSEVASGKLQSDVEDGGGPSNGNNFEVDAEDGEPGMEDENNAWGKLVLVDVNGGTEERITWIHLDLVVPYVAWAEPAFELAVSHHLQAFMRDTPPHAHITTEQSQVVRDSIESLTDRDGDNYNEGWWLCCMYVAPIVPY